MEAEIKSPSPEKELVIGFEHPVNRTELPYDDQTLSEINRHILLLFSKIIPESHSHQISPIPNVSLVESLPNEAIAKPVTVEPDPTDPTVTIP